MKYGSLRLEKSEYILIKRLLNLTNNYKDDAQKKSVVSLREELKTAIISNNEDVPEDVVRMNSEVTVASGDGWNYTFTVVEPTEFNNAAKRISVMAPMGLAVIGYAKGDIIHWTFPGGDKDITILEVKQNNTINSSLL